MNHEEIEKIVLERITPTLEEQRKLRETIEEIKSRVEEEIKNKGLSAEIELVGSTAKDTYLRDNLDIDIFLVYPRNLSRDSIARETLGIGRRLLVDTEECYAEHPYIRGYYKGYKVEIVPCYRIEDASEKKTAVDRTPLHTRYIIEHLKNYQKREVRLLKQFLKGINCYGAEAEIQGFSGYLCELLIVKYDDFRGLLGNAVNWRYGETITFHDEKPPYFDTPLVVIDPVDKNRNVAAAVSTEKFKLFTEASREYLREPRLTFFFPNPLKPLDLGEIERRLKRQGYRFIGLEIDKPSILPENLYPQLRKTCRAIEKASRKQGFNIYDIRFHVLEDKIFIIIKTDIEPLSETYIQVGPPISRKRNVKEFLEKWLNSPRTVGAPFEKNNRLYVEVKRKYRLLREYLRENLSLLPLGKHISKTVSEKGFNVLEEKQLLLEELRVFWTEYLDPKPPWER